MRLKSHHSKGWTVALKAMLHEAIFDATCNTISDVEPYDLKSSRWEIASMANNGKLAC
jgi:hypothetical protein